MTYFFRADLSRYAGAAYPLVVRISSARELRDYYERNRNIYQFNQGYYSEDNMAESVFSESSGFDDVFFATRFLLFIIIEEGSGSVRHKVETLLPGNGTLPVNITRIIPDIGTADMAQWHIVLALDKALSDKDVEISFKDELLPCE